jgi:hypothetical protein
MDINKWAAEKCGITERNDGSGHFFDGDHYQFYEWTMQDARCRELVREHFKVCSDYFDGCWKAWSRTGDFTATHGEGDTISEAEISCIEAIMKADG